MSSQTNEKHKTVGVSFPPALREDAAERARSLGLSFSKYVTLCVESELRGSLPQLVLEGFSPSLAPERKEEINLDQAIARGHEYGEAKALAIEFENDIERILADDEFCYSRSEKVAHLRTDFLIRHTLPETDRTLNIALECKRNIRQRYTVTLGQCVILQSLPGVDAVVLCVPYRKNFDRQMAQTFDQQGIKIATPDSLSDILEESINKLSSMD